MPCSFHLLVAIVRIAANQVVEVIIQAFKGGQVKGMPTVLTGQVWVGAVQYQLLAPRNIAT